jgi:hypothetical protein
MDPLILEQEALELSPLSRILLADLLYTSLEIDADRAWTSMAVAECESRFEACQRGEMQSVDSFEAIAALRAKFAK